MFSNDLKKKVIEEIVLNSSSKLDDASLIENTLKIFKVKKKDLVRASNYFFPNGLQDVIFEYSNLNNLKFRKEIKNDEIKNLKIREKIFFLVMKRIRFNSIEISKNLTKYLTVNKNIILTNRLLFSIADEIWFLAGDRSLDFNYYTKRLLLMKIYVLTFLMWLRDASEKNIKTENLLRFQINNVLRFGKLKSKITDLFKARFS